MILFSIVAYTLVYSPYYVKNELVSDKLYLYILQNVLYCKSNCKTHQKIDKYEFILHNNFDTINYIYVH